MVVTLLAILHGHLWMILNGLTDTSKCCYYFVKLCVDAVDTANGCFADNHDYDYCSSQADICRVLVVCNSMCVCLLNRFHIIGDY